MAKIKYQFAVDRIAQATKRKLGGKSKSWGTSNAGTTAEQVLVSQYSIGRTAQQVSSELRVLGDKYTAPANISHLRIGLVPSINNGTASLGRHINNFDFDLNMDDRGTGINDDLVLCGPGDVWVRLQWDAVTKSLILTRTSAAVWSVHIYPVAYTDVKLTTDTKISVTPTRQEILDKMSLQGTQGLADLYVFQPKEYHITPSKINNISNGDRITITLTPEPGYQILGTGANFTYVVGATAPSTPDEVVTPPLGATLLLNYTDTQIQNAITTSGYSGSGSYVIGSLPNCTLTVTLPAGKTQGALRNGDTCTITVTPTNGYQLGSTHPTVTKTFTTFLVDVWTSYKTDVINLGGGPAFNINDTTSDIPQVKLSTGEWVQASQIMNADVWRGPDYKNDGWDLKIIRAIYRRTKRNGTAAPTEEFLEIRYLYNTLASHEGLGGAGNSLRSSFTTTLPLRNTKVAGTDYGVKNPLFVEGMITNFQTITSGTQEGVVNRYWTISYGSQDQVYKSSCVTKNTNATYTKYNAETNGNSNYGIWKTINGKVNSHVWTSYGKGSVADTIVSNGAPYIKNIWGGSSDYLNTTLKLIDLEVQKNNLQYTSNITKADADWVSTGGLYERP